MSGDALVSAWRSLAGPDELLGHVELAGPAFTLPSVFAVTDLATASVAVALLAVAERVGISTGAVPDVRVDRRHVALAFACEREARPVGWEPPPLWDPLAGDYRSADGWIRLHTNYAHHRAAALRALGLSVAATRDDVVAVVAGRKGDELEQAIVDAGGCAAVERSIDEWRVHPQGAAVATEPLVARSFVADRAAGARDVDPARPLAGVRVLDLTRVIAGPVATRFLAAFGAEVLRIDPVAFEEVPTLLVESTAGKRTVALDLRAAGGRAALDRLLAEADVLVSGYRPGALAGLGFGPDDLADRHPRCVTATLDAYGWTGPWSSRRGFDSLVQMSTGITDAGRAAAGGERPVPLPVQALDHATGYLMAAAIVRSLNDRDQGHGVVASRCSLARTAGWLIDAGTDVDGLDTRPVVAADHPTLIERTTTSWGAVDRVRPIGTVSGAAARWDLPPGPLGAAEAIWAPGTATA